MCFIKKSLSSVVVLTTFLLTTSAFAMDPPDDDPIPESIKRALIQGDSATVKEFEKRKRQRTDASPQSAIAEENRFFVRENKDIALYISQFLSINDLAKFERTNKTICSILEDAYQYQALVRGWEICETGQKTVNSTFKKSFLHLKEHNLQYKVHFADLWREEFPLCLEKPLPLIYYWEARLSENLYSQLYDIYVAYIESKNPDGKTFQASYLGKIVTGEECYREREINTLVDIAKNKDTKPKVSLEAKWLHTKLTNVNTHCLEDLQEEASQIPEVSDKVKANLALSLAEDYLRFSSVKKEADALLVRQIYQSVLNSPLTPPSLKAETLWQLAKMDTDERLGEPNYDSAYEKLQRAFFIPAKKFNLECEVVFSLAENAIYSGKPFPRAGYVFCEYHIKSPKIGVQSSSSRSLFYLSCRGLDISPEECESIRTKYLTGIDSKEISEEFKAYCTFAIAEMDRRGLGLKNPDYSNARKGYENIALLYKSDETSKYRELANFILAQMNFYGIGLEKPEYELAYNSFNAIVGSTKYLHFKTAAWFELAKMDLVMTPPNSRAVFRLQNILNINAQPQCDRFALFFTQVWKDKASEMLTRLFQSIPGVYPENFI